MLLTHNSAPWTEKLYVTSIIQYKIERTDIAQSVNIFIIILKQKRTHTVEQL